MTIKDIADKAGVAPSTVSNVLNGTKYVSSDVADKVMRVVKELNYAPNMVARSMRTKSTQTIGVIVPELNVFFAEIVSEIETQLYQHGYNMLMCSTAEDKQREIDSLNSFLQRNIDGMILLGTDLNEETLVEDYPVPIVMVDRQIGAKCPSVFLDNELGGYLATKHLCENQARRIALIVGSTELQTYQRRASGYRRALREFEIAYDERLVCHCDRVCYEAGWEAMKQLSDQRVAYDAVFAANDFYAIGALKYLLECGVSVPHEVKVVGFDDIQTSQLVTPALTTIRQPKAEMGSICVKLILDMIHGVDHPEKVELSPELVIRQSSCVAG